MKRRLLLKNRIGLRNDFTRKAVLTLAGVSGFAAPAKIAFDVASIKAAVTPGRGPAICFVPCTPGERLTIVGNRVDIRYMPISDLLIRAYRVKPYQVSGPEWIRNRKFDIQAKMPEGAPADRVPEMLQSLLADRFRLAIHREVRQLPVYGLAVGKRGMKLQPAAADAVIQRPPGPKAREMFTPEGEAHMDKGGITIGSGPFGPMRSVGSGKWEMLAVTMPALAEFLTPSEDRPVIDETNVAGAYRLVFEVELEEGGPSDEGGRAGGRARGSAEDAFRTSLRVALEKGGLRLERRTAPVETIVIDHVEQMPTAN